MTTRVLACGCSERMASTVGVLIAKPEPGNAPEPHVTNPAPLAPSDWIALLRLVLDLYGPAAARALYAQSGLPPVVGHKRFRPGVRQDLSMRTAQAAPSLFGERRSPAAVVGRRVPKPPAPDPSTVPVNAAGDQVAASGLDAGFRVLPAFVAEAQRFLADETLLTDDPNDRVSAARLHRAYIDWHRENGVLRALHTARFGGAMTQLGLKRRTSQGGVWYAGLRLDRAR